METRENTSGRMPLESLTMETIQLTTAHVPSTQEQLHLHLLGITNHTNVGDHYCESGNTGTYEHTIVHINDPLWDGEGCGTGNNCCAQPGMPWFCRTLPQEVEGDIEVRICADHPSETDEDVYIELLEVYIQ